MPNRPSKKAGKEDQNAYVRSLSDGELMSRLRKRYSEATLRTTDPAEISAPEATREVAGGDSEKKATGAELVSLAQKAMGIVSADVATSFAAQAAAAIVPSATEAGDPDKNRKLVETAVQLLGEIKPEGALQSMLAVQMIGVHSSAGKFLRMATAEGQTFDGTDANVHRAVRLMRLFNEQLATLASLRGKTSEQKVTVEHVHVYEGGQAIVGNVAKGGSLSSGEGRE
jgi:hypothetical protein